MTARCHADVRRVCEHHTNSSVGRQQRLGVDNLGSTGYGKNLNGSKKKDLAALYFVEHVERRNGVSQLH